MFPFRHVCVHGWFFFFFFFTCKHSMFSPFLHLCFSHTVEPRDRWGVRFLEDVQLIFKWYIVSAPMPTNLLPSAPQAMLLNLRLTNCSICLVERKSSSNAQVSVISLTWCCLFLIFQHTSNLGLMPPVLFSTSEMRGGHVVSSALLHSPTYMHCTYAHMHACTRGYMACVNTLERCFMWIMVTSCEL